MSKEQIEQLNTAVKEVGEGFAALKSAQEQAKKDSDTLIEAKTSRIAEDTAKAVEKMQGLEQQLQAVKAAIERTGVANDNDKEEGKEAKAAFTKFLRKGDRHMTAEEVKYLTTDSLPDGGYMVPVQTLAKINGRIFETSPMRSVATVVKTSNKSVEMILDDQQASAGWLGEGDPVTETATPQLGRIEIVAKKMAAYPRATTEMIQDSAFDVEAWLADKVADFLSRLENTAFVLGDGVSQPRGFLTYPNVATAGAYQRNAIEQVNNGSATATTENGLITLQGSLKEAYQARASFMMKRSTLVDIMKLNGTTSYRFFNMQPTQGSTGQVFRPTLMEKPLTLADDMPVIATNALPIAYGDFGSGYTIVDRTGISTLADPYTLPGFVRYFTTKRTGGGVTNFEAIKLLKMA